MKKSISIVTVLIWIGKELGKQKKGVHCPKMVGVYKYSQECIVKGLLQGNEGEKHNIDSDRELDF